MEHQVLIVEDEATSANTLEAVLRSEGYNAKAVGSAEQAFELVRKRNPAPAIMDVILPSLNGIELGKRFCARFPAWTSLAPKEGERDMPEVSLASLRVLLVEDHPLMQQAICDLLSQNCVVVGALDRAEDISYWIHALQPDVLVLDISLPGRSGLQALPELRNEFPRLGIVIASSHIQPIYQTESLNRGADGFVLKDRLTTELWPAVKSAHEARDRRADTSTVGASVYGGKDSTSRRVGGNYSFGGSSQSLGCR